jgi:SAM-dependent methyltransferase
MPVMSAVERTFCRNPLWNAVAGHVVLPWALQGVEPRGDVLEIGGGSGAMARQLLRRHPGVRLTLTDLDEVMLARARRELAGRATVTTADATRMPFPDASFDLVLSFLMLHHVVTWEDALHEVARVLRPGGRFVGYDLLDTPPSRAVHTVDRSPHRLVRRHEFADAVRAAGMQPTRLRRGGAGSAIRFVVDKP